MSPRKTSTWNRSSTAWRWSRAAVERAVQGVDDVHEQVIDHEGSRLSGPAAAQPGSVRSAMSPTRTRGSTAACSPTRTRAAHGSGRRRRSSPCAARWRPAPMRSSSTPTGPRTATSSCATTRPSTGPPTATGAIADLTLAEVKALDSAYWFIPGADVTPGRPRPTTRTGGGPPTTPSSGSRRCAEVLEAFPDVILNLDIKQSAPAVAPYEQGDRRPAGPSSAGPRT